MAAQSSQVHLWLRAETKAHEARASLTPTTAKQLQDAGFKITIERDAQRAFLDSEYSDKGLELAPSGSWTTAPAGTIIFGLKELPESTEPLTNDHIQFAHCFKSQAGWQEVIKRFGDGKSTLYDLEFLQDDNGRRVAAFGFHAGFAGAAIGTMAVISLQNNETLGHVKPFHDENALIQDVKQNLVKANKDVSKLKALVIGALGRCGKGAIDFFQKLGLQDSNIIKWDMKETAKGGPFNEILDVDIFVNCIYLSQPIPAFVTSETINQAGAQRQLKVIVDVSCDTTNPNNPIPVCNVNTTFDKPTAPIKVDEGNPPMLMVTIDHLPTLLPRDASEAFSSDLMPSLLQLPNRNIDARVWLDAEKLFKKKLSEA